MTGIFKRDTYLTGAIIAFGTIITISLLIFIFQYFISGFPIENKIKYYIISFIPNILLIRYYFKKSEQHRISKAILFITFFLFVVFFILSFKIQTV